MGEKELIYVKGEKMRSGFNLNQPHKRIKKGNEHQI